LGTYSPAAPYQGREVDPIDLFAMAEQVPATASREAASVQKQTNNSSGPGPRWRGREVWKRFDWLRENSVRKRQRLCQTVAVSDVVTVVAGTDNAHYSGVRRCGSRLCPTCGPAIAMDNGVSIAHCIRQWREAEGGRVLFGTLTVRHNRYDDFSTLRSAISDGWAAVTSGRGWLRDRKRAGVAHWIRVFEEKWSLENGWHLHVHYLMFIRRDSPDFEVSGLLDSMFSRWSRSVTSAGLRSPLPQGQDLREVYGDGAEQLSGYFSKQVTEAEQSMTADDYRRMGFELTAKDGKTRVTKMGVHSITPGELLGLAMLGDPKFLVLWREYERGMEGRRVIAWSRGLREWAGVGFMTDEEIAQAAGDKTEPAAAVIGLDGSGYKKLARFKRRAELLRMVVEDGVPAAVEWLTRFGIRAWADGERRPDLFDGFVPADMFTGRTQMGKDGALHEVHSPDFDGDLPF
jgi:hypothetical protein